MPLRKLSLIFALCLFAKSASAIELMPCNSDKLHEMVLKAVYKHVSEKYPDIGRMADMGAISWANNLKISVQGMKEVQDKKQEAALIAQGAKQVRFCKFTDVSPNFFATELEVEHHTEIVIGNYGMDNDDTLIKIKWGGIVESY